MKDVLMERDGERIMLHGGVPPKEKDAATIAFEEALVGKLKGILAQQPLSSRVLLELEMASRLGRQFLMINEGPAAMPRQGFGMGDYGGIGSPFEGDYGGGLISPIVGSPPAETWGAGVLRELVAKIGDVNKRPPSLGDLMDALRMAEKDGRTEIVEKLKKQIDLQLSTDDKENAELDALLADGSEFKPPEDPPHGLRHVPEAVAEDPRAGVQPFGVVPTGDAA